MVCYICNKRESVVMKHLVKTEIPKKYEAFLYQVTIDNDKIKNKYIGSKKGLYDRTYKGTPVTFEKEYFEDLGKFDSTMKILAFGTYQDILYMERKMLVENNAKYSEEYFNASNLSGHQATGFNPHLDFVYENIMGHVYRKVMEDKKVVFDIKRRQVRNVSYISGKVTKMLEKANDTDGKSIIDSTAEFPIPIFEDYHGNGKHMRIDGTHTTKTAVLCKFVSKITVMYIPKKDWKKLSNDDIHTLGQRLNPQFDKPRDPTPKEETVDWLVNRKYKENIEIKSQSNREELIKQLYTNQAITSMMKEAVEVMKKNTQLSLNEKICIYSEEPFKSRLERKRENFNTPTHGMLVIKSSMTKNIAKELLFNLADFPDKTFWKIMVWHASVADKEKWESLYLPEYKRVIKKLCNTRLEEKPLTIVFDSPEFTYIDD